MTKFVIALAATGKSRPRSGFQPESSAEMDVNNGITWIIAIVLAFAVAGKLDVLQAWVWRSEDCILYESRGPQPGVILTSFTAVLDAADIHLKNNNWSQ